MPLESKDKVKHIHNQFMARYTNSTFILSTTIAYGVSIIKSDADHRYDSRVEGQFKISLTVVFFDRGALYFVQ